MSHNVLIFTRFEVQDLFKGYGDSSSEDNFECQTNGVISESIVQNWTIQALDCFKLNCNCTECPIIKNGYSFKCQMKNVVAILIAKIGLPDEQLIMTQVSENNKTDVA